MKNLITCAFAFKEGFGTSKQLDKTAGKDTTEMYLKDLYVALVSAKTNNPEDDVYLSVNIDIEKEWQERFEKAGVQIRKMAFDTFVVPKEFPWSLAFFKMCVLNTWVREGNYDRVLILDADTYTTLPYISLWKEADFGVMLYPLGHSFYHSDRETIRRDFEKLYPDEAKRLPITHYGGEFICGNNRDLTVYMDKCLEIFERISENGFSVEEKIGDEDLWSIAAALLSKELSIIPASPYVFRFWTTDIFYLVSTCTVSNAVAVWHLPQEKETGLEGLYEYHLKNRAFPAPELSAKMLGIVKAKRPFNRYTLANKVNGKLKKWKIKK